MQNGIARTIVLLVAAISSAVALSGQSQQSSCKVAIVNMQAAIVGTKDGQTAQQELTAKVAPKQKEFDARQNEIVQLDDQLRKGGNLMAEAKRQELSRSIEDKKKRLQRDMEDADENLQAEQRGLLQTLGQKMLAVITQYAKDNQYSMVIDDSNPNTPVLYSATSSDITKEVIALYDKSK